MMQAQAKHVENEKKEVGRWYPTHGTNHEFVAKCGVCGRVRSAVELKLKRLPWGRGEVWACHQGC